MISFLRLAYIVAFRRIISNWKQEMILLLGIVMAVALMSSGVIFSDLLAEASLGHSLDRASPTEVNFMIRSSIGQDVPATLPARVSAYHEGLDFVDRRVADRLEPYLLERTHLLESPTFFYQGHPQLELDDRLRPRGKFQFLAGLPSDRLRLVDGHWPYDGTGGPLPGSDAPLEVAVDALGSQLLQLSVGDEMEVFPATSFIDPPSKQVKIAAVFERVDPKDQFWYGTTKDFSLISDGRNFVPLFTTEDAILNGVVAQYPPLSLDITWYLYLDRQGVREKDVDDLRRIVSNVKHDVTANLRNSFIANQMVRVLADHKEQLLLARIPLFMILFLVVGILIYYLGLVCGLVVKSRGTEIAMLKSRGATTTQVGSLALTEAVFLAVPAVILGPLLALGVVRVLGRVFFGLGGSGELAAIPVTLSSQAYLLGLAGGLLAVAALTILTLVAARQGIVEFRQSGARPPRAPFIHRYYLDLMLLVLIGALWWQTQSRDTFLVRPLGSGELEIDYSLLLGPALGLLAISLLVLRVFPLVVAVAARITELVGPNWLVHGLRQVSRDPIVPGVLVILLMLATALGVIGSTFSSTLERSREDRALYAAGADLRITHGGTAKDLPLLGLADQAKEADSITGAAEVKWIGASLTVKGFSNTNISVLGVDSENIDKVAWYRNDFARGTSLFDLIAPIRPDSSLKLLQGDGIQLPIGTTALALWVQENRPDPRMSIRARLQDGLGQYFDTPLGQLGAGGWQRLEGDIRPPATASFTFEGRGELLVLTPPFTLLSLHLFKMSGITEPGALFLGGLEAVTDTGKQLISDFQSPDKWHVIEDFSQPDVSYYALEPSELAAPAGSGKSAVFSWAPGGIGIRGLRAGATEEPIPAVVSRSFIDQAQAQLGDVVGVRFSSYTLNLKVAGLADYFPTLNPVDRPFAIVDLQTLNHNTNLHSPETLGGSNELWVGLPDRSQTGEKVIASLEENGLRPGETHLASKMVAQSVERPLVNAGWGSLLVLVFLVLALASTTGVMLFSYTDTNDRQTEFALLRTLGSSSRQLNGVVWFSVILVVVCGIGLGSLAGPLLGASMLPLMEVAEEGARVTPPMVLQTNWMTLLVSYLVLAGVTAGTVAWLAWITSKMEVQRVLRIGDL